MARCEEKGRQRKGAKGGAGLAFAPHPLPEVGGRPGAAWGLRKAVGWYQAAAAAAASAWRSGLSRPVCGGGGEVEVDRVSVAEGLYRVCVGVKGKEAGAEREWREEGGVCCG